MTFTKTQSVIVPANLIMTFFLSVFFFFAYTMSASALTTEVPSTLDAIANEIQGIADQVALIQQEIGVQGDVLGASDQTYNYEGYTVASIEDEIQTIKQQIDDMQRETISTREVLGASTLAFYPRIASTSKEMRLRIASTSKEMKRLKMKTASSTVDLTCMQTAVDTREAGIMNAFKAYSSAVVVNLTTRKSSLHDAWGMSDRLARNAKIKSAWKTWKDSNKDMHRAFREGKKDAWDTFRDTVKSTCKTTLSSEEAEGLDTKGEISF